MARVKSLAAVRLTLSILRKSAPSTALIKLAQTLRPGTIQMTILITGALSATLASTTLFQLVTSRTTSLVTKTSMNTAAGAPLQTTAPSGSRTLPLLDGLRITTATGLISRLGVTPGSMMRLGDLLPFTTDAG